MFHWFVCAEVGTFESDSDPIMISHMNNHNKIPLSENTVKLQAHDRYNIPLKQFAAVILCQAKSTIETKLQLNLNFTSDIINVHRTLPM